jgi:hypothetical protein
VIPTSLISIIFVVPVRSSGGIAQLGLFGAIRYERGALAAVHCVCPNDHLYSTLSCKGDVDTSTQVYIPDSGLESFSSLSLRDTVPSAKVQCP